MHLFDYFDYNLFGIKLVDALIISCFRKKATTAALNERLRFERGFLRKGCRAHDG
jgi:hypothetical protein